MGRQFRLEDDDHFLTGQQPTDPREWQQQGPDPEGRGDGRSLFPEGSRWGDEKRYQPEEEIVQWLTTVHGISSRPSYRFEYRYRVLPSKEVLELAIEHYSREKADQYFPFEAWLHHPGPRPPKRRRDPQADFHLSWDDLEILSVNQVPIGDKPYFSFSTEPHRAQKRRPLKRRDERLPVASERFRKRWQNQKLHGFINWLASRLAPKNATLKADLVQAGWLEVSLEPSDELRILRRAARDAMKLERERDKRQRFKDLPEDSPPEENL